MFQQTAAMLAQSLPPMAYEASTVELPYSMPATTYQDARAFHRPSSFFLDPSMMLHRSLRGEDRRDNRRNFHRKVRTGCATCKARHVKCDETKPECKRCTSTGRECSGYEEPKKDRKAATLLPRDRKDSDAASRSSASSSGDAESSSSRALTVAASTVATSSTLAPGVGRPALPYFVTADPREKHYLSMFLSDTFPSIWRVEIPEPERWTRMVTQLIWDEPVVRHTAIALAAAHERQRLIVMRVRDDPSRFALEYYNRAIRHLLRTPPMDESQQTRSTITLLTCCLLFVTIEMFLNHDAEVRTHLRSGVRILREAQLASFANEEEDLLVANFEAMDAHALMYPGAGASQYDAETQGAISEMRAGSLQQPTVLVPQTEFAGAGQAVRAYNQLCTRINRFRSSLATDIPPPESELVAAQTELLGALDRWQAAYSAMTTLVSNPHMLSVIAVSVATHAIFVRGALDPTCMAYDAATPEIWALLPRLRAAVTARDPAATRFSVDTLANEMVCIWFLFLTSRDPAVRSELRGLLMAALARRGVWCGMTMAVVTDRIRAIEEAGSDVRGAEDVLSYNRLRWIGIDVDQINRTVAIVYRRVGAEGVEYETLPLWG